MITQVQLKQLFEYDAATGCLIRRVARCNRVKVGEVAGSIDDNGYRKIHIGGRIYAAHRLVWLYHRGTWPENEIDHINRNRSDNRIENLRDVTHSVTKQPPAKAGGFALRTESPDTRRLNDAS